MKKIKLLNILTCSTLPLNAAVLFACAKDNSDFAHFSKKQFIASTSSQQINVSIPNKEISYIIVKIVNSNAPISLVSEKCAVLYGNANIGIMLNEDVSKYDAFFDLEIQFYDDENILKCTNTFTNFEVIFTGQNPGKYDKVRFSKTADVLNGTYESIFVLDLYEEINSDIEVTLSDPKHILQLRTPIIKPVKDPRPSYKIWHANIAIDIPLNVWSTELFDFSITVQFTNTFGKKQINRFDDLCIKFLKSGKTFPIDFFNIVDNEIVSLKEDASISRMINDCETIIIPEGITKISKHAFSIFMGYEEEKEKWRDILLPNARKIVFPNSLQFVEDGAFKNCKNLFELDLSSWESTQPPKWLQDSKNIFNTSGDMSSVKYGYVWLNNENIGDKFNDLLSKIGVPSTWLSVSQTLVVPSNFYKYDTSNVNGQTLKTIIGIKEKCFDLLWQYRIIRIPDDVDAIGQYAFIDSFSKCPYFFEHKSSQLLTRRLILGRNIKFLYPYSFDSAGIGGPIFIPNEIILNNTTKSGSSESTKSILDVGVFKNIGKYGDSYIGDNFTSEDVHLIFDENITTLLDIPSSFCVVDSNRWGKRKCDMVEIVLPKNLKSIGLQAFDIPGYSQTIEALPNTLETIDNMAFYSCTPLGSITLGQQLKQINNHAFGMHKFDSVIFNCYYVDEAKNIKITKLKNVGDEAFGCDYANHTISLIDLSMYDDNIYYEGDEQTKITNAPIWMTQNNHIFKNACSETGKVYVSSYVFNQKDLLNSYKENLIKLGVPLGDESKWKIEEKK